MNGPSANRNRPPNQDRLLSIFNTAVDGIITIDAGGIVETINPSAERIFGLAADEVVGRNVSLLMPQPFQGEHDAYLANYLRTGAAKIIGIGREVIGRRKDGSTFPMDLAVSEFRIEHKRYFTGIVRDISDRKRAEETAKNSQRELEKTLAELTAATQQLWQTAKLASVGELAASIAHELNNPLATVSLRLESVLDDSRLDPALRHSLTIVQQEADRMAHLVGNLLQFTRVSPDQESSVDLHEELEKSVELVQHLFRKHRIAVEWKIAATLPTIFADRQKLRQVFLNLLTNACDAMPERGTLSLGAALSANRDAVELTFADTGVGIAPEHLAKVMDPFFTTKEEGKGTGLGLAICRRIVQEHAGKLTIESVRGQGTAIHILLPIKDPAKSVRLLGNA